MIHTAEWRLGASKHLGIAQIFVVTSEAVETEGSLRRAEARVSQFVKDASEIVEEVDGHLTSLGFDQCPVLLEHIDDFDPKVPALDWNDIRHRRLKSLSGQAPHPKIRYATSPVTQGFSQSFQDDKSPRCPPSRRLRR